MHSRRGSDPILACSQGRIAKPIASDQIASDPRSDRQRTKCGSLAIGSLAIGCDPNPIPQGSDHIPEWNKAQFH